MAVIRLGGANSHLVVAVDDDKFDWLSNYFWCLVPGSRMQYAYANVGGRFRSMHGLLMDPPQGMQVDHRNHNGLDNRLSNLRLATVAQNLRNGRPHWNNQTGFKGVYFSKGRSKAYRAMIYIDKKQRDLGYFATAEDAAAAYDRAAAEAFGEFAYLNLGA